MSETGLYAYKCEIHYDGGVMTQIVIAPTERSARILAEDTYKRSPMKNKEIQDIQIVEANILHG